MGWWGGGVAISFQIGCKPELVLLSRGSFAKLWRLAMVTRFDVIGQ